jgi:hypothetical protein
MRTRFVVVLLLLAGALTVARAQQPLRPPQLVPFGDSEWWVVAEPIPNRIGVSSEVITVPKGFVTDLASIPRFFWAAFPKTGTYMSAAILHDYLYWDQRCTRTEADRIFGIEMRSFGVNDTSRNLILAAVNEFGVGAWTSNATAAAAGESRLLPQALLTKFLDEPLDSTQTWEVWRERVRASPSAARASDPNPQLSAVCARALAANPAP